MAEHRAPRYRLDTPKETRRPLVRRPAYDADTFGVVRRAVRPVHGHRAVPDLHDPVRAHLGRLERRWRRTTCASTSYPFIFLTLMLSLQASYAAPLILLAQNRQEARDKVIAEQDRQANARAHADMEFLAREVASLRMSVGEVATRDFLRSELRSLLTDLDERARRSARTRPSRPGPTADDHRAPPRLVDHEHPVPRAGQRRPGDRQRPRDQASDHRPRHGRHVEIDGSRRSCT